MTSSSAPTASLDQMRARSTDSSRPFSRSVPHRLLGYVPAPNFRLGEDQRDALGFRGPGLPLKKARGEFRIVCLGGSTTYTSFVEGDALAYPALRPACCRRNSGSGDQSGVPGYAGFEFVANLRLRALELEPDMISVYHAINDVLHRMICPPGARRADDSRYLKPSPGS